MTNEEKLVKAIEALEFYANPDTYFAISFMVDRPCGEFAEDFSEDHGFADYLRHSPGKLARITLEDIEEI